jgi:PII-like signaling protein
VVDEDGIELASYSRERHRADGVSLSGAFIDLFAERRTAASVLLRSTDGFGAGQARGGRSRPLADDLSLTVAAVDTRANIEALLSEALRLAGPRLVTLGRVRLLTGEIGLVSLGEKPGEATRLTLYCGRQDRAYQVPAYEAACELLYRREIAGATVLPGIDGTHLGRRERAQLLHHSADVPLVITAVGAGERIAMLLPELGGLFRHPLMTVAKVGLCKREGEVVSRPQLEADGDALTPSDMAAMVKLTVYTSEAARHDGRPVHQVIVHRLRSAGLSGATSVRGIWGFRRDRAPHGDHFPHRGHHLPVVTTVIDTPERISAAFDVIDPLTPDRGLVTAEAVLASRPAPVAHDR